MNVIESEPILDLKKYSHIHFMGICGTAMASLAGILKERGHYITGSDQNVYPPMSTQIENLGIPLMKGYHSNNLSPRPDLVIVGNVISKQNEEAQELLRLGIPYTSLPSALGRWVIENRESIVISGTHGKTTTTSLMAWVAHELKLEPGFLIGGVAKNFSQSFRNPKTTRAMANEIAKNNYFIIEGDEYDTAFFDKVPKFVHYKPRHVILTSVEFDHADIYNNLEEIKNAFIKLVQLIPQDGTLIYCKESPLVEEIALFSTCNNIYSYSSKPEFPDSKLPDPKFNQAANLNTSQQTHSSNRRRLGHYHFVKDSNHRFTVLFNNKNIFEDLQQPPLHPFFHCTSLVGDYNLLNATAVIGLAHHLLWDLNQMQGAITSFLSVKRRQEVLGEPGGILIIEDFAHHPTAVRETILAIQEKYSPRKVFSVFEPRSATSRRKVFQKDYVNAFSCAHEIVIAPAFAQENILAGDRFSSEELVADLVKNGKSARSFPSVDEIVLDLLSRTKSGDIILLMSNGAFGGIYQKLLSQLG